MKTKLLYLFGISALFISGCGDSQNLKIEEIERKNKKLEDQLLETRQDLVNLKKHVDSQGKQLNELRTQIEQNRKSISRQRQTISRQSLASSSNQKDDMQKRQVASIITSMMKHRPLTDIAKVLNDRKLKTSDGSNWDREKVGLFIREYKLEYKPPLIR